MCGAVSGVSVAGGSASLAWAPTTICGAVASCESTELPWFGLTTRRLAVLHGTSGEDELMLLLCWDAGFVPVA
jgi:hypothetical protein